jgi:Protein of unknown function (DUF3515)
VADEVTRGAARLAALIAVPVALVVGLLAFWGLGGFHSTKPRPATAAAPTPMLTAPVPMPAPSLSTRDATMCLAFIAQLPGTLRGLPERPVTAGPEQNAAFGTPPIQVACGGRARPSVPPDAFLPILSGVCWYADQSGKDVTVWTTLDRQVPITVTMPDSYQGQGDWMQEFSAPIITAVPSLAELPAVCAAPSTAPS